MRIAGTLSCSFINGYGTRYVIFVQGCAHKCKGCHNPETWDFNGGREVDIKELVDDILKRKKHLDGVTLSGGDPFYQQEECVALLKMLPPELDIWIYTGFKYEEIEHTELAKMADVIVDGPYIKERHCEGQLYGSDNQRIIFRSKGK